MTVQNVLTVVGPCSTPLKKGDLAAVGFGLQAAGKIGGACDVLLLGGAKEDAGGREEQVASFGVRKVYSLSHADLEAFTARLYAELFRTPLDDPWLGLAAPEVYAGLPRGGRHLPPEDDPDFFCVRWP